MQVIGLPKAPGTAEKQYSRNKLKKKKKKKQTDMDREKCEVQKYIERSTHSEIVR